MHDCRVGGPKKKIERNQIDSRINSTWEIINNIESRALAHGVR